MKMKVHTVKRRHHLIVIALPTSTCSGASPSHASRCVATVERSRARAAQTCERVVKKKSSGRHRSERARRWSRDDAESERERATAESGSPW